MLPVWKLNCDTTSYVRRCTCRYWQRLNSLTFKNIFSIFSSTLLLISRADSWSRAIATIYSLFLTITHNNHFIMIMEGQSLVLSAFYFISNLTTQSSPSIITVILIPLQFVTALNKNWMSELFKSLFQPLNFHLKFSKILSVISVQIQKGFLKL